MHHNVDEVASRKQLAWQEACFSCIITSWNKIYSSQPLVPINDQIYPRDLHLPLKFVSHVGVSLLQHYQIGPHQIVATSFIAGCRRRRRRPKEARSTRWLAKPSNPLWFIIKERPSSSSSSQEQHSSWKAQTEFNKRFKRFIFKRSRSTDRFFHPESLRKQYNACF